MPNPLRLTFHATLIAFGAMISSAADAASTQRVSVTSAGVEGDSASLIPALSADGRFVVFHSNATNLVLGDTNGFVDVFVHDRQTGMTERVSIDSAGVQGNGDSQFASISANGRFVVFRSFATNLVTGDTNEEPDTFLHDRQSHVTERVSVGNGGQQANNDSYTYPSVSADGRFVAFASEASNLVAGDNNGDQDVFVRDRQAGVTERVSVDSNGTQANGQSLSPTISANGRFVVFPSYAADLIVGDTNGVQDTFVHDRVTGETERVNVSSTGVEATADSSFERSISIDGRFVAFSSDATNLVPGDTNGYEDVFVRDRLTNRTERVSLAANGSQANGDSSWPTISADGQSVVFQSTATNLIGDDTNGTTDVFVHDRRTGRTERVSVSSSGQESTFGSFASLIPSVSGDGRFIAFYSSAPDLVANDTNLASDVFVRDRGLLPDGNNDFLADFGGAGLWQRLNDAAWQKIHHASPSMVGSGDLDGSFQDEAIASFGGAGLWARYDNATWMKLHSASPKRFVVGDFDGNGSDDLVTDFGAAGIWVKNNNAGWTKLHNGTSQDLAVGDLDGNGKDDLIVDFGAAGLWVRYNNTTWVKQHNASPVHIATGDLDGDGMEELIVDFGGAGIWARYNNVTWMKLHNGTSQGLATGDLDGNDQKDLVVDFGAAGLWVRYNNATWVKRHPASPQRMLVTDLDGNGMSELVVDFGGAGLWVRTNNATWMKLHNTSPQDLAAGGFD